MPARILRSFTTLLVVLFLIGCSSGGAIKRSGMNGGLAPPDTTSASGAYEGATDYRIGAQDLLAITVFGVEELNKEVRVNSNGQISLPLIGGVLAGGRTIPELEADLAKKYSAGYLQKPQVTVFVKEYTSQRVTLEGQLNKPGIYPITGKTTLLQAIATAQGVTEVADLSAVVIFRQIEGKRMAAAFNLPSIRRGDSPDPQVYGDDIVVVEKSGSKSALREFIKNLPAIGFFMGL